MSDSPVDKFKSFSRNDQVVLATGVLAFIFSFFPYWGASASGDLGGASKSVTAWHSYSTFALLLILIGTGVTAALVLGRSMPDLPVGPRWISAGICALGALLYAIRLFTLPSDSSDLGDGFKLSYGVKWGGYLLLVIVLVNAVFAVLSALSSDESKPWESMGGGGGAVPPPPPPAPPTA